MPVHDWTRVEAGIFHHFHHAWIEEIARALNRGVLPREYYAMAEQHAAGFGPDVLTLQGPASDPTSPAEFTEPSTNGGTGVSLAPPRTRLVGETDGQFYHRKQNAVVVRHVSGDRIVAMVEVVSPGNKASRYPLQSFIAKAEELMERAVQLLILDLQPPGPRDPQGIHGAIWEDFTGQHYTAPADRPLTLVAYESGEATRAYVESVAVGEPLPDMPLFLKWGAHVLVPVEATYQAAYAAVPRRWQRVLESPQTQ